MNIRLCQGNLNITSYLLTPIFNSKLVLNLIATRLLKCKQINIDVENNQYHIFSFQMLFVPRYYALELIFFPYYFTLEIYCMYNNASVVFKLTLDLC